MVHYLPITKARINLGQVVRRVVRNKEYFNLEKDGIPVAGILGADELEDYLELQNPALRRNPAGWLIDWDFRYTLQFEEQRLDEDSGMAGLPGVSERDQ